MHLEYCIENGKFDELIHHVQNVDPDSATETNVFSQTPLHLLCSQSIRNENENVSDEKLIEVIKTLVDAYPDALTDIDEQRRTPLHCACLARPLQPSIIAFLLAPWSDNNKIMTGRSDIKVREESSSLDSRDGYPFCAPLEHMHMRQVRAANTPLHLLCQSSLWSSTDDEETLFRVLKLILTAQPWTCLTRNRVGVSPIYLMFGWKYNNRNNPVRRRQSMNDGQGFLFFSEEEQQDEEWKRRWKAVLYMIRYVAVYHRERIHSSRSNSTMKDSLLKLLQEEECDDLEDDFLYLHATLHVDRTCPVWDTILHFYGHQVSMLGTCHGMKCHKGGEEGDYPLAIAATQCNFSSTKIANQFITNLCDLYPEAARRPVQFCGCGGTVLEHAIQNHLHFNYSTKNNTDDIDEENHSFGGALGSILLAYPDALRIPDQVYGFYPFMLSATLPTMERKKRCKYFTKVFSSKLTKWSIPKEESNILNTTYTLLRMAPDLLAHFLSY